MAINLPKYKFLQTKCSKGVQEIIFSRPEVLNALNESFIEELLNEVNRMEKMKEVRFVVLRGEGGKAFSVGADLKEGAAFDEKCYKNFLDKFNSIAVKIEDSRLIYFAAIDGYAVGGGLEVALACDFRLATSRSIFGLPEVRIGVIPGGGGSMRIVNVCGLANAKRITLLGEKFNARLAEKLGLLHEVVQDRNTLDKKVDEYISILNQGAPLALSKMKKCLNYSFKRIRNEALRFERERYRELLKTSDLKEGLDAFRKKRKPRFKGK